MTRVTRAIQQWHGGRIALLWVAVGFVTVLLLAWQDALTTRAKEIRSILLAISPDTPSQTLQRQKPQAGTPDAFFDSLLSGRSPIENLSPPQKQYIGGDSVLWTDSSPKDGTPERIALDDKKRQVRERLARTAQRDEALATGIPVIVLGILPVGLLVLTWIWFGRASDTQPRKTFRDWHPGKIILLWCIALVALYAMVEAFPFRERTQALILWAVLASPVMVVTWKWLSGREAAREQQRK